MRTEKRFHVEHVCVKGANRKLAKIWRQDNVNYCAIIETIAAMAILAAGAAYVLMIWGMK